MNYVVKNNDKVITFTCRQEEFSMYNQSFFKNTTIDVMVYSIISKKSYETSKMGKSCKKFLK
jgi:hypothetical protein